MLSMSLFVIINRLVFSCHPFQMAQQQPADDSEPAHTNSNGAPFGSMLQDDDDEDEEDREDQDAGEEDENRDSGRQRDSSSEQDTRMRNENEESEDNEEN